MLLAFYAMWYYFTVYKYYCFCYSVYILYKFTYFSFLFVFKESTSWEEKHPRQPIELDQIDPYAEEIDIMASAYKAPHLCTDYCDNVCPIGIRRLEEQAKHTEKDSIERLVLKFISSSHYMHELSKILVNITQDGVIDKTEIHDLQDVFKAMDSVSENIEAIRFWVMNDPALKGFFDNSIE